MIGQVLHLARIHSIALKVVIVVLLYIVVEEDEEAQSIYRCCIALVMSNGHWVELRGDTRQVVKIRSYVVM